MIITLEDQIKALREKWGMSIGDLADKADVHIWNAYDLEESPMDSSVFIYELYSVAKALGARLEIKLVEDFDDSK